ncbi:hypothetical protein [Streptomyces sp. NL15-2K]|uniref:hypothetical protein n=1 Tax=Streptomyces sp. NL15-2K TaxID=376149 RepID=UPI00209C683A|nr:MULTISPECIES: hypothetical protein [Actinomycetes]WKX13899.1 hypothetical protein Q4V64_42795 [Kutzneria buriramensis]
MRHADDPRDDAVRALAHQPSEVAYDHLWAADLRSSIHCSAVLLSLLLVIDWVAGSCTLWRGALWAALAVVFFLVLFPPRVAAGEGWLASRGLLRERRIHTGHLVSVRCLDGVGQRLVLRDTFGGRLEIDPRVLIANPPLWHRLNEDAHVSANRGSLTCGTITLLRLSQRIDRETARTVFKVSGLE